MAGYACITRTIKQCGCGWRIDEMTKHLYGFILDAKTSIYVLTNDQRLFSVTITVAQSK